MPKDPLSIFVLAKAAEAAAPSTLLENLGEASKPVTLDPDPSSLDPGERALAGIAAVSGSLAAKLIPYAGQKVLADIGMSDAVDYKAMDLTDVKRMRDIGQATPGRRGKILGLFDVEGRQRIVGRKDFEATARKFNELEKVVDSFIDKHNLVEKGVRMRFPTGLAGELGGSRYNISSKQVHLPELSKPIALHELGHAADYTKGRWARFRGVAEPMLERGVLTALPIALIAGDQIKEMLPGTIDDKAIGFMQDHAPEILGATLAATQLYPEAKASYLATKHIADTQGRVAAREAVKKLAPLWGTYLLGTIPAVIGMSLARKYMREARQDREQLLEKALPGGATDIEKVSGALSWMKDIGSFFREGARDIGHVGKQVNKQSIDLIRQPGTMKKITNAAKAVGTDPEFVHGAIISAMPASLAALYLYGTNSGGIIRSRAAKENIEHMVTEKKTGIPVVSRINESWREQHPLQFAGLIAAGAALSGGIMSKFLSDLGRVV